MESVNKQERRRQTAGKLVQDFARSTSLHGLQYIAERGLSRAEKVFWIVSFVTSLSLCAMLIWNVWVKWQTIPIIVTLSEDPVSVQEVPFPSVTICPCEKIKQSVCSNNEIEDLFNKYTSAARPKVHNRTLSEENFVYEAICLILGIQNTFIPGDITKTFAQMVKISPSVLDSFVRCEVNKKSIRCIHLFEPVLTMEGVCFTMNSLAASEILRKNRLQRKYSYLNSSVPSVGWSHSEGYSGTNSSADVYPRRGSGSTYHLPEVEIFLKHKRENKSVLQNSNNDGFKVYLHHPADLPQSSAFYYSAPLETSVSLGLKLNVINTSSSLRSYTPETRRCYFPEERKLRYFLTYTENNCRLECLANYTLKALGCVWFHMPHNNPATICRSFHVYRMLDARKHFDQEEGGNTKGGRCRCYPLCLQIKYEADVLRNTKFNNRKMEILWIYSNTYELIEWYTFTRIELFYKEPRFVSMRRSELFGLTDFLANCGGLLGLFLGFSFLSLVEVVYFLTLRLGCSLHREKLQADSATENKEQLP